MKNFVFAFAIIFILFFGLSIPIHYVSATSQGMPPEDSDVNKISSLIDSATTHVNQTTKAIENGNSSEALTFLTKIQTDLKNINGNVTDLIFSVSETPP